MGGSLMASISTDWSIKSTTMTGRIVSGNVKLGTLHVHVPLTDLLFYCPKARKKS